VQAACTEALKAIPKGSLAGGVHCAAVATSRKWSNKMVDSVKVRKFYSTSKIVLISTGLQKDHGHQRYWNIHH
ncbi:hypothetical protein ACEN88_35535, partial [Massilia sp. CT11-108]|uniref:hypothetical protein n=1 Tax=Massilia sp. CT11-108 TaxID=3393900 RepID=UPI0039A4CE8D